MNTQKNRGTLLLIGNSKAGILSHGQEVTAGINSLEEKGFRVIQIPIEKVLEKDGFNKIVQKYVPNTVVAVGGDGTVNLLASYLVGTDMRLGVIPAGTFNHFARHVGIGTDIITSFITLINGHTILIDSGEVNGRTFVNFSCIGFYTELIKKRVFYQKQSWQKWHAFMRALYENLLVHAPLQVQVIKNGAEVTVHTPLIFVGNNIFDFGGPDILSKRSTFTSGKLQVSIAAHENRWKTVLLLVRSFFGDIKYKAGLNTIALDQLEIHTRKSHLWVTLDGEVAKLKTPLNYKILPKSLRVIVPKE